MRVSAHSVVGVGVVSCMHRLPLQLGISFPIYAHVALPSLLSCACSPHSLRKHPVTTDLSTPNNLRPFPLFFSVHRPRRVPLAALAISSRAPPLCPSPLSQRVWNRAASPPLPPSPLRAVLAAGVRLLRLRSRKQTARCVRLVRLCPCRFITRVILGITSSCFRIVDCLSHFIADSCL